MYGAFLSHGIIKLPGKYCSPQLLEVFTMDAEFLNLYGIIKVKTLVSSDYESH